jgi:hypothetical protein
MVAEVISGPMPSPGRTMMRIDLLSYPVADIWCWPRFTACLLLGIATAFRNQP